MARITKSASAAREAAKPEATIDEAQEGLASAFNVYLASLGRGPIDGAFIPTKRLIASFVCSLAVTACGMVAGMHIANALAVFIAALGFPAFIAAVVYLMTYFVAVLAALYAGGRVAKYIATGRIADDVARATGWVASKLGSASTYVKQSMAREHVTVH